MWEVGSFDNHPWSFFSVCCQITPLLSVSQTSKHMWSDWISRTLIFASLKKNKQHIFLQNNVIQCHDKQFENGACLPVLHCLRCDTLLLVFNFFHYFSPFIKCIFISCPSNIKLLLLHDYLINIAVSWKYWFGPESGLCVILFLVTVVFRFGGIS